MSECVAACYSVFKCVAVYCSVLQFAKHWSKTGGDEPKACQSVWQRATVCCSVLQCVAVFYSV